MKFIPYGLSLLIGLVLFSCSENESIVFQSSPVEDYRPEYHFTPATGWMNDPNGLIYLDGEYHLFYQFNPDSAVWGPMHWGHAITKDLINWENLPIALAPDSLGYIFSGSVVYDSENSSGLGTIGNPPLVALYTYHDMVAEKHGSLEYQSQALAYSVDKGRTWTKFANNPVLPNQGIKDFRDPKVSRITNSDGTQQWMMTLAVLDRIQFYASSNLIDWEFKSEFGVGIGAHGGVWECPDLLPFNSPDGNQKWVLLVSINPGGPQKGSATQYFIGEFMDGVFTADDQMIRWMDYGPDNYAGVTWSNLPKDQNRTILIGWMSNWLYAEKVPTQPWRSSMTIPRALSLFEVSETLLLKTSPVKEMENLRSKSYSISSSESALPSVSSEIKADVLENFSLKLSNDLGEQVLISKENGLVSIDRSRAGNSNFHPDFAALFSAPMSWKAEQVRIFLDASSIELFVNDGELAMTALLFPNNPWNKISLISGVTALEIFELKK